MASSSSMSSKLFLLISSCLLPCVCFSRDTLKQCQSLNTTQTIVSANGIFELGFFSPGKSQNFYLGIWFRSNRLENRVVVWVANRENPFKSTFCSLSINREGNLAISNGGEVSLSFTSLANTSSATSATLLDDGNFVLRENNNSNVVLWQSFDHPSDTLLPGMKLGHDVKTGQTWSLTSWVSSEDPSPGSFSFNLKQNSELSITKDSQEYWTIGESILRGNFSNFSYVSDDENGTYFKFGRGNNTSLITRLVMDSLGKLNQYLWLEGESQLYGEYGVGRWSLIWQQPKPTCDVYALCGSFGACNSMENPNCNCLPGFQPNSLTDWRKQDWSSGCVRKTPLQCGSKDRFLLMENVTIPMYLISLVGLNVVGCELECLKKCSCSAYVYDGRECTLFMGELLNIVQNGGGEIELFIRVAASEIEKINGDMILFSNSRDKREIALITTLPVTFIMLILGIFAFFLWRKKLKQGGKKETGLDLLSFDFSTKTRAVNSELSCKNESANGEKKWEAELPFFSFSSISVATDNFSDANKLGQGGFGLVYKGKLLNGQEVAIKRLSRGSRQGLEELKNEATLIAKLQHRNLVRLLGCCIEDEEKILIYEYMPNKSLDFFIFDAKNKSILDWEKRVYIIDGIAQGLFYLHQHSRLRIIHRDLKASNILLDNQMNAKISDFGMARIFGGNELQANTSRVVGTYGYMSPEYVMEGLFSIKSDVFSFGVLLIEILSSKRNTTYDYADSLTLLGHAWNLWNCDKGHELIDPILLDSSSFSKALRYINVGLLCVQEVASDRPTMSDVVTMLSNEVTALPLPKQPAFCTRSNVEKTSSLMRLPIASINYVSITSIDGR
ncbi:hypothetical protein Sjap_015102 [Stephania japonica]|uniref:Receptor-like serine/threonine-protein kinase n=1 Tax=Stephania japonica TaxID=461633 RepID=A0AAP0NSJ3_9MAGN